MNHKFCALIIMIQFLKLGLHDILALSLTRLPLAALHLDKVLNILKTTITIKP